MKLTYTTWFKQQFFDDDGKPLAFGTVRSKRSDSGADAVTYNANGAFNSNPIVLDESGSAVIRVDSSFAYKFIVSSQDGSYTKTYDNVFGAEVTGGSGGTDKHNELTNRDLPDQHPITSIQGLEDSLSLIGISINALGVSVSSIESSLSTIQGDITDLENGKVNRSGDTMTGSLSVATMISAYNDPLNPFDLDNGQVTSFGGLDSAEHTLFTGFGSDVRIDSYVNDSYAAHTTQFATGKYIKEFVNDDVTNLQLHRDANRFEVLQGDIDGSEGTQVTIESSKARFEITTSDVGQGLTVFENRNQNGIDTILLPDVDGTTKTLATLDDITSGNSIPVHGVFKYEDGSYEATASFNNSTREISLSAITRYYITGVEHSFSAGVIATIPNTVGMWIVYVDNANVVQVSTTYPNVVENVLLFRVYWNGTEGFLFEERHGYRYPAITHAVDHFGIGTCVHGTDPTIAGYVLQPLSPVDNDNTYSITQFLIQDEDNVFLVPAKAEGDTKTIVYKNGSAWVKDTGNTLGYIYQSGGKIKYNQNQNSSGSMVEVQSGKYVNYYIVSFVTYDQSLRLQVMAGANQFDDPFTASSADTLTDLYLSNLDAYETVILWRITYSVSDSYSTTGRCRIETVNYLKEGRGAYRGSTSVSSVNTQNLNVSNNTNLNGSVNINATMNINGQTTLSPTTKIGGSILGSAVVVTDSSGNLTVANSVSTTELGYLDGVTSSIQTQLNAKANSSTTLAGYGITDALDTSSTNQTKNGALLVRRASASLEGFGVGVTGDATSRVQIRPDGIWLGDGTSAPDVAVIRYNDGTNKWIRIDQRFWANLGIFVTGSETAPRTIEVSNADTNAQRPVLKLKHTTRSASANGFGAILEALGEDSGASEFKIGAIDFVRTTANGTGDVYLQSALAGAYQNVIRLGSDKVAEFFGAIKTILTASQYVKTDANSNLTVQNGVPLSDITTTCACEAIIPDVKVRAVSTANLATLSGNQTVDGIALVANDFVLLKNQTTASQNGVWMVNAGAWTRAVGFDTDEEIRTRIVLCMSDGTTNKNGYEFVCTNTSAITVGTTSLTFAQVPQGIGTGATNASAGNHTHTSLGALTLSGALTARSLITTRQSNTPTGTTYTWTLTNGNDLLLTLTSSTGNVTVTTASPTAGSQGQITAIGHGSSARDVSLTQSGVTWWVNGVDTATTIVLGSVPATKKKTWSLYWESTTSCHIHSW